MQKQSQSQQLACHEKQRPPNCRCRISAGVSHPPLAWCTLGAQLKQPQGRTVQIRAHHAPCRPSLRTQPTLPLLQQPHSLLACHHDLPKGCVHHGLAGVERCHPACPQASSPGHLSGRMSALVIGARDKGCSWTICSCVVHSTRYLSWVHLYCSCPTHGGLHLQISL